MFKRERERAQDKLETGNNKANKVVFNWLFKNNENAVFAKIRRFDWL